MAYGMDELGSADDEDSGLAALDPRKATPKKSGLAAASSDAMYDALSAQRDRNAAVIEKIYGPQMRLWDQMAEQLKARRIGPSPAEQLFNLSAAFFKPTAYRGFGATLGNVMPVLAQQQEQQRTAADEAYDLQQKYMLGRAKTAQEMGSEVVKNDNSLLNMLSRYALGKQKVDALTASKSGPARVSLDSFGVAHDPYTGNPLPTIPKEAIEALVANPQHAADFDKKYGPGMSTRVFFSLKQGGIDPAVASALVGTRQADPAGALDDDEE